MALIPLDDLDTPGVLDVADKLIDAIRGIHHWREYHPAGHKHDMAYAHYQCKLAVHSLQQAMVLFGVGLEAIEGYDEHGFPQYGAGPAR